MNGRSLRRGLALAALLALAAACSTTKKSERPAELKTFQGTAKVDRLWQARIGSGAPKLRLGLSLAAAGDTLFAASYDGNVSAFNQASGKRLWRTATKLPLTAGPGTGEGLVVAGASHGDIVALDAATGKIKWKSYVNSELLSAPYIDKGVVVLRAVDGRVVALNAGDGKQLWSAEQEVPRLSLRGTARPSIVGDMVYSGFDNGRVLALQLSDGSTVWDANVAPSTGTNELERLNDIDTSLQVRGNKLYVVTFQGKAAQLDLVTGQILWSRDESSYSGLTVDDDGVYITTADGTVTRLNTGTGVQTWESTALSHRRLSPPALLGDLLAVADFNGYVHFFDRGTGKLMARTHPLSARVSATPLAIDGRLFVLDTAGDLVALRATPVPTATKKKKAATPAEESATPPPAK